MHCRISIGNSYDNQLKFIPKCGQSFSNLTVDDDEKGKWMREK